MDQHLDLLRKSQRHFDDKNYTLACEYAKQSLLMQESVEGRRLFAACSSKIRETEETLPYTSEQLRDVRDFGRKDKGDLYGVLGVSRDADDETIKKAYRKLALKFHPDKNGAPGADEVFKAISKAFSVLNDKEAKDRYDHLGMESPGAGPKSHGGVSTDELFETLFRQFAHNSSTQQQTRLDPFFGGFGAHMHTGGGPFMFSQMGGPFFMQANPMFMNMNRRRRPFRRADPEEEPDGEVEDEMELLKARLEQFLPFIFLLLLSIITSWFGW